MKDNQIREQYINKIKLLNEYDFNNNQKELAINIINTCDINQIDNIYNFISQRVKVGFTFDIAPTMNTNSISYLKYNDKLSFNLVDSFDSNNLTNNNILIIGENYDALKNLLLNYKNKVDVIYIDPPYNTEATLNDKNNLSDNLERNNSNSRFVYNDKFSRNGWLNMIKNRIDLAYQLLSENGVIFVSIDDNEQGYLKVLMDTIFGENNFISSLVWKARRGGGNDAKFVANDHEYILVYAKDINKCKLTGKNKDDSDFKLTDEWVETRGKYNLQQFDRASLTYTVSLDYPIETPDGTLLYAGHTDEEGWEKRKQNKTKRNDWRWMMSKDTFEKAKANGFIVFEKNKNGIWNVKVKTYQYATYKDADKVIERKLKLRSCLTDDFGTTKTGNIDIDKIGLKHEFSYPKPVDLIKNLLLYYNSNDCIVLDFFAGSGTTGQSVLELNKLDNGNRKFILVTNNAQINNTNKRIGYDVTYERLYRLTHNISTDKISWIDVNNLYDFKNTPLMVFDIDYINVALNSNKFDKKVDYIIESNKKINSKFDSDISSLINKLYSLHPQNKD